MKSLFILLLAITLNACSSNDDDNPQDPVSQLPPATMTGENTFGFLLNGKPINVTNSDDQFAIFQGGFVQFGAKGVTLVVDNPIEKNIAYSLVLNNQNKAKSRLTQELASNSLCIYEFADTYSGTVTFTNIDTVNYIISGEFNYSTVNNLCENIKITNGRFDLQYIP